jgi:hypothetical protein
METAAVIMMTTGSTEQLFIDLVGLATQNTVGLFSS